MSHQRADQATPARLFVLVAGAALVIGGIGGFFYESDFGTGSELVADEILGLFPTNGWDNVLHLLAGFACLAAARRAPRAMALAVGTGFTVLAVWGMIETEGPLGSLLDVIPVDTEDNLLHLALGLSGIAAAVATPRTPPTAPA